MSNNLGVWIVLYQRYPHDPWRCMTKTWTSKTYAQKQISSLIEKKYHDAYLSYVIVDDDFR